MGHHQLDTLDEQILKLIADNARIPFLEVARACNVSGAAIHQRIQKLTVLMNFIKSSRRIKTIWHHQDLRQSICSGHLTAWKTQRSRIKKSLLLT